MSAEWDAVDQPDGAQAGTSAANRTTSTPPAVPDQASQEPTRATPHAGAQAAPSPDELAARFRASSLRVPEGPLALPPSSPDVSAPREREMPLRMRRVFIEETGEDLEHMRAVYLQLTHNAPDPAKQHHTLKQIAHKIKGSAATFTYPLIARVAHALEEWIERADAATTLAHQQEAEHHIGEGLTLLDALAAAAGEGHEPAPDLAARAATFAATSAHPAPGYGAPETRPMPVFPLTGALPSGHASAPHDGADDEEHHGQLLHVPTHQVDALINELSEVAINRALLATVRAELSALEDELCRTQTRLESRAEIIGDALPRRTRQPSVEPVSEEEEELSLAARSLCEAVGDLGAHVVQFRALLGNLGHAAHEQDEQMRAIRDEAVHMRLVPFSTLENRLRVTAEICGRECGKAVELTVTGGDTRIDRDMMDQLRGPLIQIITNAVVHAIETPEQRARAGKSPYGHIFVEARLRQSEVHITIADDGQGSDTRVLVRAALGRGILSPAQAREITPARALNLMFEPGLTTEDTASLLAGRGIGLDQVRTTVRDLRGQISVQSNMGQGTIFRLRLPISQTVLTVIEVASAGEHFAIPLPLLSGIFSLTRSGPLPPGMPSSVGARGPQVFDAMSMEERARLVERLAALVRDTGAELSPLEGIRVLSLAALLAQRTAGTGEVALLLEVDGGYAVVLVDEVLGEREVVVRQLAPHLRRLAVWGAAVTPEGEMLLLLDLPTLVHEAGPATLVGLPTVVAEHPLGATVGTSAHVLVVDDSPTVRRNVSGILKQAGYRITEARDGVEAIGQLAAMPTDVIVLDIEMPDLDGLGLLRILKSNPHFADVPVVVLSSRDTAETRQQARALGVHTFLPKPCRSDILLSAVRRLATR